MSPHCFAQLTKSASTTPPFFFCVPICMETRYEYHLFGSPVDKSSLTAHHQNTAVSSWGVCSSFLAASLKKQTTMHPVYFRSRQHCLWCPLVLSALLLLAMAPCHFGFQSCCRCCWFRVRPAPSWRCCCIARLPSDPVRHYSSCN